MLSGWGSKPKILDIASSCHNYYASSIDIICSIVLVYYYCSTWRLVTYVRRGTSPPTMTSPGRASTWTSLKPRQAAKQDLEARMWLHTPAQWRKSPRLERWPVAEQLTQTKCVTAGVTGGPAAGPAMDAIATTSSRVQTPWMDCDVTSCIACQCQVVSQ